MRRFPVLEVQHTFYEPPADAVLARWRAQVPAGFEFTIKTWQVVTHESNSLTYRQIKRPLPESARDQVDGLARRDVAAPDEEPVLPAVRAHLHRVDLIAALRES